MSRHRIRRTLPARAGVAAATLALGVAAVTVPAAPAAATSSRGAAAPAATAAPSPTLPPPPACPTAVAIRTGGSTSAPRPASALGGPRLARPGMQVDLPAGTPAPPAQRATAWIVVDLTTDTVVAACNAHVPLAPASTLKVLTALALRPVVPPSALHTATPADAAIDGSKVGLVPGSVYTGDDLWHGLLMGSGNDTANALATMAGGLPAATEMMNRTARRLGAADTVARNTSGLDAPGQVSSVYDLAVFGRAALADPGIAALVSTSRYRFPAAGTRTSAKGRKRFEIQNHNRLLGGYRGTTGIKNGYTQAAGGSFVASARRGSRSYLVALLRTDAGTWKMARSLLEWAFTQAAAARPVGVLATAPVPDGALVPPTTPPVPPGSGTPTPGATVAPAPGSTGAVPPPAPGATLPAQAAPLPTGFAGAPAAASGEAAPTAGSGPGTAATAAWLVLGAALGAAGALALRRRLRR